MGSHIQIDAADDSGQFQAYLALPESGHGPLVVLGQEIFGVNPAMRQLADLYAEEGYVVLVPDLFWRQQPGIELGYSQPEFERAYGLLNGLDLDKAVEDIACTIAAAASLPYVDKVGGVGFVGFCLGGKLAYLVAARSEVAVSIGYYGVGLEELLGEADAIRNTLVLHIAEQDQLCPPPAREAILAALGGRANIDLHVYHGVDHAFARPGGMHFDKGASDLAHGRSIAALRKALGPHYDLEALWDEHTRQEFVERDVPATMATMVDEPYVNHIPTMTGGVGQQQLARFYQHHFVHGNPPDTELVPVSRTVGATQLVDEFILRFTHTTEIDWLLPGVAPTGHRVEVPMLGVIRFRGPKLCHEHIYWDQASVLVQVGLLDPKLLPVAGAETAHKLLDETLPSNTLMKRWAQSEGQ